MAQHWIAGLKPMAKALATRLAFPLAGLLAGLVVWLGCLPTVALAGPVNWQEVPSTAEGRQWWDSGSLRATKTGNLSVLSRFQPPNPGDSKNGTTGESEPKPKRMADLYVMDIDFWKTITYPSFKYFFIVCSDIAYHTRMSPGWE